MAASDNRQTLISRTFKHKWVIKKWKDVVRNQTLTENTTNEIDLEDENVVYATFLVGTAYDNIDCVGFYWKLLWKLDCLEKVSVNLEVFNSSGGVGQTSEVETNAVVGTRMDLRKSFFARDHDDSYYPTWTNSEGSLITKLKFTLKNLPDKDSVYSFKTKQFSEACRDEFSLNLASLLDDKLHSDVKIVTRDKTEFFAHKNILRARCPVFASMFGSDFLESSTGLVNADDISAKTMKILLQYWYSGELSPSWEDDDTIVEFTYAAGKYQMTNILSMLNDVIGWVIKACDNDVELLKLTQQLSLRKAEARLFKRIVRKLGQVVSGAELLDYIHLTSDSLDEESFSASQILKVCDDVMCDNDDPKANCQDLRLMALAVKFGRKNVENKLVKRIVNTVVKMDSADELFALFEITNEEKKVVSEMLEDKDLLVRVNNKIDIE